MSDKSIWTTRHSLLGRISDPQDQRSWDEFINRYQQFIYNILRKCGLDETEADDLRQVIFIKLWEIMPENPYNKEKGKFRNWLAAVIKNEALQYLRQQLKRKELLDKNVGYVKEQLQDENEESALDKIIQAEWENHLIIEAWDEIKKKLKDPAKTVFQLALEGKKNAEIAKICEINEGNVRVYKQRVKQLIKTAVEKNREDEE